MGANTEMSGNLSATPAEKTSARDASEAMTVKSANKLTLKNEMTQISNYQKAKEEGINTFGKIDMGKQRIEDLTIEDLRKTLLEVMNKLPSFAEKIKEGVEADIAGNFDCRCKDRLGIPKHKDNKCDCKCHHLKALSSDSQIIENMIDISITPPPLINEIE